MESVLLQGLVLVLGFLSAADCRLVNVTFTNTRGEFIVQSPNWPNHAPPMSNIMWELTSPPGTRVNLVCSDIRLLKRAGCTEGSLTIWDGTTQYNICAVLSTFTKEANRNKMFIQFRGGWFGIGRFQCVARVIEDSYLENISQEVVDSSEHGSGVGARSTTCPCGWANKRRIVGGTVTGINEYVFPVSIRRRGSTHGFCGGSIITPCHILTAAHCTWDIRDPRTLEVLVGEHDVTTATETNVTEVVPVLRVTMHEQYDHDEMTNDIAIVELTRCLRFNQFIGPVCLPNERYNLLGQYLRVLGWGLTSTGGRFANALMKVDLQVVPLRHCASRYTNKIDLNNPTQICTFTPNKDSCQGDSGGPLIAHDHEMNRYYQAALVSYGKECASEDPAVNIDVFAYINWINRVVARRTPAVNTCHKV